MTEIKGYYTNGTIKLPKNLKLKEGQEVSVILPDDNQNPLLASIEKYRGTMRVYGSTERIDEYIKECRSE